MSAAALAHSVPAGAACNAERRPRVGWLGGWGVAPEAMLAIVQRLLPAAEHRVFAPTQAGLAQLQTLAQTQPQEMDFLGGYSTGAFLLLREAPHWKHCPPLRLFAPFLDFRAEAGLGGRVVTTRLKLLLRRLRVAPLEAVVDFYLQSGIALTVPQALPYAAEDLLWGIEQLAQTSVSGATVAALAAAAQAQGGGDVAVQEASPLEGIACRCWVGAADALLDGARIAPLLPDCCLLPGVTHDFESLLCAALNGGGVL